MIQLDDKDVYQSFLNRNDNFYNWPPDKDHSWQPIEDIICVMPTLDVVNRGQLTFPANSLEEARNLALNMPEIKTVYLKYK